MLLPFLLSRPTPAPELTGDVAAMVVTTPLPGNAVFARGFIPYHCFSTSNVCTGIFRPVVQEKF
jgi:hypothetical protein